MVSSLIWFESFGGFESQEEDCEKVTPSTYDECE